MQVLPVRPGLLHAAVGALTCLALAGAAGAAPSCPAGAQQRSVYALHLRSQSQVDWTRLFQGQTAPGAPARTGPVPGASNTARIELDLRSDLLLQEQTAQEGTPVRQMQLRALQLRLVQNGQAQAAAVPPLQQTLEQAWVQVREGADQGWQYRWNLPAEAPLAASLWETLLGNLQLRAAPNSDTVRWQTREQDAAGHWRVTYHRTAQRAPVSRERVADTAPPANADPRVLRWQAQVLRGGARFALDAKGHLLWLHSDETLGYRLGEKRLGQARVRLDVQWRDVDCLGQWEPDALAVSPWRALAPATDFGDADRLAVARATLGTDSLTELQARLDALAQGPATLSREARTRLLLQWKSWVLLQGDSLTGLEVLLERYQNDSETLRLLLDALAGAGTPAAQRLLLQHLRGEGQLAGEAPAGLYGLRALAFVESPTAPTVLAVQAMADDAELRAPVRRVARLVLGSLCAQLREPQLQTLRQQLLDAFESGLQQAQGEREQVHWLMVLGNARPPGVTPALRAALQDGNEVVRRMAQEVQRGLATAGAAP